MPVVHTPAVALRAFPYGETSLVVRFYAEELGVVGVMAKGARKRGSKGSGVPETFSRGVLTVYVKEGRGLQTMKDFAPDRPRRGLGRDPVRFAGASILGEILLRHAGEEGSPHLFERLNRALDRVETVETRSLVAEVLARGWSLVSALGYRPALERCVACGRAPGEHEMARFDFSAGGIRCAHCGGEGNGPRVGPGAREQLRALVEGVSVDELRRPRAHLALLDDFVTYHLSGGRRLDSFRIFLDLLGSREEEVRREGDAPGPLREGGTGGNSA